MKALIENDDYILKLIDLVPRDLKPGKKVITKCPFCGDELKIERASLNGHIWIICKKEGLLLCQ